MMQQCFRNLYKSSEIFFCQQRMHKHSEKGTSVWHILRQKECYPEGCLTFRWRCLKFDQGKKCHRGRRHVGRDCFSCKFFYDIKENFQPELKIDQEQFKDFSRRLAEFEDWINELKRRRVEVRGEIVRVLPNLVNLGRDGHLKISCRGALIYFRRGLFGYDRFDDPFWVQLSFRVYNRYLVAEGDEIELLAELQIDRGRFVFKRSGSIELLNRGGAEPPSEAELRQGKYTGSLIDGQPAKCLSCRNGILIDNVNADGRRDPRRGLYCLEGVADHRYCPFRE